MTRREAATLGLRFFDVARPCKHDGDLQRYVSNGVCVTCAKRRAAAWDKTFRDLQAAAKAAP